MAEATSSTKWVWVAIDVAKRWNEVLVEPPQGRRRRFKMAQTRDDYESLAAYLHSLSCSKWLHETEPSRPDQAFSGCFLKVATHPETALQEIRKQARRRAERVGLSAAGVR